MKRPCKYRIIVYNEFKYTLDVFYVYGSVYMQKLIRWMYVLVIAVLFVYACFQYGSVRRDLAGAQVRLTGLYDTASRLREENRSLSYQIDRLKDADSRESAGERTPEN